MTDRGFLIKINEKFGGFVLIRHCCEYHNFEKPHCIAEFFVMKKYRRQGIGKYAARIIFEMFEGNWEVCCWGKNLWHKNFWKKPLLSIQTKHIKHLQAKEWNNRDCVSILKQQKTDKKQNVIQFDKTSHVVCSAKTTFHAL